MKGQTLLLIELVASADCARNFRLYSRSVRGPCNTTIKQQPIMSFRFQGPQPSRWLGVFQAEAHAPLEHRLDLGPSFRRVFAGPVNYVSHGIPPFLRHGNQTLRGSVARLPRSNAYHSVVTSTSGNVNVPWDKILAGPFKSGYTQTSG